MDARARSPYPVYVWEAPVRIWHWVMALAMVVLAITGYLIGSPLPSVGGEASEHYFFGAIRFTHFVAAYVFTVVFVLRVAWAFLGNRFAREIFSVPLKLFDGAWWRGLIHQTRYYLFLEPESLPWQGHNPLAMAAMFFMYVLGSVFMILTGFALYGEGLGRGSWAFTLFSSWVLPLLGYSQNVHTLHHLGMWYLLLFTGVHLYMATREDIFSEATVMSTMVNGWRVAKK
ncbi:MAG TPA: Ni/Fe-hydrogenase, b-type cytochrome subunit [Burkholderiaceae bacterium]|nr:Ni/Fe-hydrogenase, b-type cytochrome subunit [Burkholderiaceae bacterium]